MSSQRVDILLSFKGDAPIADPLVDFFSPVATVEIEYGRPTLKAAEIFYVILSIAGTWATEKYLLDPLSNRVKDWWKSLDSVRKKANFNYKFSIVVQFEAASDKLKITLEDTYQQETLQRAWEFVRKSIDIYERERPKIGSLETIVAGCQMTNSISDRGVVVRSSKQLSSAVI